MVPTFQNVNAGNPCATACLDVNRSQGLDSGDVISTAAEVSFVLYPGETTLATVDLDSVKP